MVAMRMGDENLAGLAKIVAGLNDAARHAVAGVDQIQRPVDHQQIGRLRAILGRQRPAAGAEGDQCRLCGRMVRRDDSNKAREQ